MADVFISYSRHDGDFVRRLHQALADRGRDVWVDWEDIPPASEWRDELHEGIDDAKAVIFVMSPRSLGSDECHLELTHAIDHGKRIVPVVWEDPDSVKVPEALANRNWVFLRERDDFDTGVSQVETALDADPAWVRTHTRLLNRAQEWDNGERSRALVLRGTDLHAAESALAGWREGTEPAPTSLQREYVQASRHAASQRLRGLVAGLSVALLISIGLGVFALIQRSKAVDREHIASSRQLAVRGLLSLDSDPDYAMRLALQALHRAHTPEAERALRLAVSQSQARGALRVSRKPVASVAVNSGGLVASATADGKVRVWDPATGRVRSLHGHRGTIYQLGFSHSQRELLSDGADGVAWLEDLYSGRALAFRARGALATGLTPDDNEVLGLDGRDDVEVWDAHTGRLRTTLPTGGRTVQSMAFDRHGRELVVTYPDGRVQAWDVNRRARLGARRVKGADFVDSSLSTDGTFAVSIGDQDRVDVWDPRTGRLIHGLQIPNATPLSESVTDDGRRIAVGYNDNTARIWDARTGRLRQTLRGHSDSVKRVSFNDDDRRLMTMGYDDTVRVWNTATGEQLARFAAGAGGFENAGISPDGRYVATGGHDGVARLWEAAPGRTVAAIHTRGSIAAAALDPTGKVFASAGSAGFQVASALTGRIVGQAQLPHTDQTYEIAFDSHNNWLAAGVGSTLYLISSERSGKSWFVDYDDVIRTVDWSPDGSRVVTAADDGAARVIDPATRRQIRLPHAYAVYQARFMPDGDSVVTADSLWVVRRWRLSDRKVTDQIKVPTRVTDLQVSRTGQVAIATDDGDVVLWWPGRAGPSAQLHLHHKSRVEAVRFSRDGRRIATAGDDAKARLWDTGTGRPIREFPSGRGVQAHTGILLDVDISPDGRYLITGSDDRTARVWDTGTGDQVAVFAGYDGGVFRTRFSPRRHSLLTVPTEGTAALYACDACLPLSQVVKAAHRLLAVRDVSHA